MNKPKIAIVLLILILSLSVTACKPAQYENVYVITQDNNTYYCLNYYPDIGTTLNTNEWWTPTINGVIKHTGRLQISGTYSLETKQFQKGVLK